MKIGGLAALHVLLRANLRRVRVKLTSWRIGALMRLFVILAILGFMVSSSAFAKYEWGFADMSLNHLIWSDGVKAKSSKKDFTYLELEGGGQFSWGEVYGFFDIENIGHDGDEVRTAGKGSIRYYLPLPGFSVYAHVYDFNSLGFGEQNRVIGFGYQVTGNGWWFKPFLGVHDVSQTYFSGLNGFMGGWIAGYGFKIGSQDFLVADWHEWEFARKEAYALGNGNKSMGQNGAASIWWNATPQLSVGLQWRYAVDKLGTPGVLNAGIATVRYNF